jgi:hypothetical protein
MPKYLCVHYILHSTVSLTSCRSWIKFYLHSNQDNRLSLEVRIFIYPWGIQCQLLHKDQTELQNDILSASSSYCDLYLPTLPPESSKCTREALALHTLNHVSRSHLSRFFQAPIDILQEATESAEEQRATRSRG